MKIRLATERDYNEMANMRWLHAIEDDTVYGENNTYDVDKEQYINKVVKFLTNHKEYKIFVVENNGVIISCMYVYLVPKIPSPNGNSEYIGYLTKVFTKQEYRNNGIGTELLDYVKKHLIKLKCELIFAWPSDNSIEWYNKNNFSSENDIVECILMEE